MEAGSPRSACQHAQVLVSALFLDARAIFSPFYKDTKDIMSDPTS